MNEKYLINSANSCVDESFYGFSLLHPHLEVDLLKKVIFDRAGGLKQKIAIISGGGSGHEPFPSGYVGEGMLTASVSGSIFSSPPSGHILHAIRLAASKSKAVLLVVPNYTGDILNFGLAAEIAEREGIIIRRVVVGEDIAQQIFNMHSKAGQRGTCGLILAIKIAGYLAQKEENLDRIVDIVVKALNSMTSLGLCISPCIKPGVGPLFHLEKDEMELGIGVHGEAGVARLKIVTAREVVTLLLSHLIINLNLHENDEVIVMINNLGSLTYLEQWLIVGEVEKYLTIRNIIILRLFANCFFTSLNMKGLQICLMKLTKENKQLILQALDHSTSASAWSNNIFWHKDCLTLEKSRPSLSAFKKCFKTPSITTVTITKANLLKRCLLNIVKDILLKESHLNSLDSSCGDGDCGTTLKILMEAINSKISANEYNFLNPEALFNELSITTQEVIGGTTGAIYGLFFNGISKNLSKHNDYEKVEVYVTSWKEGINNIKKYSTARLGDRTLLDSLETACIVFERAFLIYKNVLQAFHCSVKAAIEGCDKTRSMKAVAGRASYTDPSQQTDVDAGAYAVTIWLSSILKTLEQNS